jgi:hypothetical protein
MKIKKNVIFFQVQIIILTLVLLSGKVLKAVSTEQWSRAGGQKIFSANIQFKNTYSTDGRIWWEGDPWATAEKRKIVDAQALNKAVSPLIGQITVKGSGHIALIEKCENHASIKIQNNADSSIFYPFRNTFAKAKNGTISEKLADFTPGEFWGKIPENQTLTLDIYAAMAIHDVNIYGLKAYGAPQSVDMELWFFPGKNGKVDNIKVISSKNCTGSGNNLKPADSIDTPVSTIFADADAYVYAYNYRNWNRSNRGGSHQIRAGWHPVGGESRAFIKFDLKNINKNKFQRAVLRLYHFQHSGNDNVKLGIYRVTGKWDEGSDIYHSGKVEKTAPSGVLSWEQQPDSDRHLIASFNPGTGMRNYVNIDITSLVREWINGSANYGLEIKPIPPFDRNTPESFQYFASKERDRNLDNPKGVNKAPALLIYHNGNSNNNVTKIQKTEPIDTSALQLPFSDNFASAKYKLNWILPKNSKIENGRLSWHTGPATNLLKLKKKIPFENICIEFDAMTKNNGFNIHLIKENNIGYIWIMGGWYNTQSGSDIGGPGKRRKLVPGKLWSPGEWNHYKVCKTGDHLKGFFNNKLIFDRITKQKYEGLGNLYFDSWESVINVNNIKIYRTR